MKDRGAPKILTPDDGAEISLDERQEATGCRNDDLWRHLAQFDVLRDGDTTKDDLALHAGQVLTESFEFVVNLVSELTRVAKNYRLG